MDTNPPILYPPLPIRSNLSLRVSPKKTATSRNQRLQRLLGGDARTRRSPSSGGNADKNQTKARTSPITSSKPLLPTSERKSAEQLGNRTKKSIEKEKWSPPLDRGAGGREGRHFTVANVGSNGQIFLRPAVRPDNQRYPQQSVTSPITPPDTASLGDPALGKTRHAEVGELNSSQWTPTPVTDPPSSTVIPKKSYFDRRPPTTRHRRAISDSTARDVLIGAENDAGVFKVVISKPQFEVKSKTAEDVDLRKGSFLQVSIPSWKLGTPTFTSGGIPLIRGSSYAPTEDMRLSHASFQDPSQREKASIPSQAEPFNSRIASVQSSQSQYNSPAWLLPASHSPPSPTSKPTGSHFMLSDLVIEPSMFDALTFKPACDDWSIVRYSSATGAVAAATPPRLVAEITSPSFLDYDLVSDFFLTFRSFLKPADLLRLLIARLRWALTQNDESGMIVKVRTFVAIRHWILNYFVDDFVVDHHLRVTFCDLLNEFTDELPTLHSTRKVPFKILGELKKCWRRVCVQYWDGSEFDTELGHDVPITPGGIAGNRDPTLTPSFWDTDPSEALHVDGDDKQVNSPKQDTKIPANVRKASQAGSSLQSEARPATPEGIVWSNRQPTSPMSRSSLDVVSCSFPTKALRAGDPNLSMALGAHPADPSSIYTATDPIASTPALMAKRMRPQTSHRRNNSLTDSLREHGTIAEKAAFNNADPLTLPYAGSLVRGNLLPPGQPFVDLHGTVSKGGSRRTTLFHTQSATNTKRKGSASAMSGQGMRKLLGSVRRALSTRGPGTTHAQVGFINIAPIGPRGATTNRLPGTAVVPQAQYSPSFDISNFRIDVLGARIVEDFNEAVREDTVETKSASTANVKSFENAVDNVEYSVAHMDSSFELRPLSDAAITTGSKSIVIVDATAPPDHFIMTGALPPFNLSNEMYTDGTVPKYSRDFTPPMTPSSDGFRGDTPRGSSYILSQRVYNASLETDHLPDTNVTNAGMKNYVDEALPADSAGSEAGLPISFIGRPTNKPPSAYFNRHRRQKSSRSYRSRGSLSQWRWKSVHSDLATQLTVKSFDATTVSEESIRSEVMPPPLRMLRRKPGGDLRGVANTTQLDPLPLRRSRSIGSLTAYSESLRSSFIRSPVRNSSGFADTVSGEYTQQRGELFSLGALTEQVPRRPLSLCSTHSSKLIMGPYELEAPKLALIPDDIDDDGGVESALLKLEGKYERKKGKLSIDRLNIPHENSRSLTGEILLLDNPIQATAEKRQHQHLHIEEKEVTDISPTGEEYVADIPDQNGSLRYSQISSFLSEDSLDTYNSALPFDGGIIDGGSIRTQTLEWRNRSILEGPDSPVDEPETPVLISVLHPSFELITRTKSVERAGGPPLPSSLNEDRSFLDVESDEESELSTELSIEFVNGSDSMPRPLSSNQVHDRYVVSHKPRTSEQDLYTDDEQSSIKLTLVQALQMSPKTVHTPVADENQPWSQKPLPPTPETTPIMAMDRRVPGSVFGSPNSRRAQSNAMKLLGEVAKQPPAHLPFILAFDSEILAQQFTLIEKDALNEVDWKELIEMKWKESRNDSRSWVDFLRSTDARGVEVVIARFNIMVKWAISEIVLTEDLEERARCIIKLIHIAAHCKNYRNFATLSQITIALTSHDVGRLSETWAMLPPTDMKTMSELETLVSPTRNFYNLRAEMEGGGRAADTGCIPFIGIYTHDLLFNSQRPSEIASSPTGPPLVNFERCRISASVIKTLLRLVEASTFYHFQPIEGITERCLWMSALSDEDIRKRSESLESTITHKR